MKQDWLNKVLRGHKKELLATQPVTSFLSAERHWLETHNEDHLQKEEIQDGFAELGLYPFV